MSKKKKRNKAGNQPAGPTQPLASEGGSLDEETQAARRAQQKAEWAAQKKKDDRRPIPASTFAWIGGLAGIAVLTVAGVFLLVSGGSDSDGPAAPTATPDPRVAGLPIAKTVDVEADDDGQEVNPRFSPTSVTGNAGEVIEIRMINVGSVAHNLRVSGIDKEYDTRDDFLTDPGSIKGGEEGSVLVKIDEPGTYPFRCDFHPDQQIGNLVLN